MKGMYKMNKKKKKEIEEKTKRNSIYENNNLMGWFMVYSS